MMPNTSVSPAASRNSSRPNCNPFSDCSITTSMDPLNHAEKTAAARRRRRLFSYWMHDPCQDITYWRTMRQKNPRSLHRALVGEAILVVLDDGRHRLERELAVGVLDHVLQVEVLDRNVVLAELEWAAHRSEVGLLHLGLHLVLFGHVTFDRNHCDID